jgi:hypothetical protein
MISDLSKKIELKFWDFAIPLLSKSGWLSNLFHKLVDLYNDDQFVKKVAIVVVAAFAGFACGFLIFSISTLFS